MKVGEIMKRSVFSISASSSVGEAAALFRAKHIGTLPVVDGSNRLIGLLPLSDVLALVMPDFVQIVEDFDFVRDFGAVETRQLSPELSARPVSRVMREAISVEENSGLLRAFALLHHHDLHDVPVVAADGKLVGIVSRVDVGTALIAGWSQFGPGGTAR